VRNLTDGELETKLHELEEEIFGLKLRRATSQLENPMKLRAVRRDLARVRTVQRERMRTSS
jgi:large subunit ribosomal protein L29